MRVYFSERYKKALSSERIKCSFNVPTRISIRRILRAHSSWDNWLNAYEEFHEAEEDLKTFYGRDSLRAFDSKKKLTNANFERVLSEGLPEEVVDCVEAWFEHADDDRARECARELNKSLTIHRSPWRFFEGTAYLLDSTYVNEEIVLPTLLALREAGALGALEEFREAQEHSRKGECKDAVTKAHKSVESVMKCVLETNEPLRFGQLLSRLLQSGLVPAYYEEFMTHFEKLVLGAGKQRNRPGTGHGQGRDVADVPSALARFALHLAASINLFLLEQWAQQRSEHQEVLIEPEDLPFE